MLPIMIGLGIGALMGGGIAALQKKNVLEGALLGGALGAGGAMLAPAAAGVGAAGAGVGAAGAGVGATGAAGVAGVAGAGTTAASGAASLFPTTLGGATGTAGGAGGVSSILVPGATTGALAAPTVAGAGAGTGIGGFLGANKYALLGGLGGGMMAKNQESSQPSQGNIYTTEFSQDKNPNFGSPGESYYNNQQYTGGVFTPVEDYKPTQMAANGGIIALAEGGDVDRYTRQERAVDPAVTAYNAKLMERANQQYNVNMPPGPNQVPGSVGYIAPPVRTAAPVATNATSDSISGLTFNPVTKQYEGDFSTPGTKKKPIGGIDYEDLDARYMRQNQNYDMGNSGGGEKNGGLMTETMRYAEGGISNLGDYSDGGQLLKGPGNGVSDSIPAMIGAKQPAQLADGEFVVPARTVSELGNGSTDAGAKQLYAMMDRVQKGRKKSIGKGKVAVDSKAARHLPA